MTKDELKAYLQTMQLDPELATSLQTLVDTAKEIDQKLLDTIADVLDLQADFYEKTAALLESQTTVSTSNLQAETKQQQEAVITEAQTPPVQEATAIPTPTETVSESAPAVPTSEQPTLPSSSS